MGQMMAEDRQGMFLFAKDVQVILGVSRNYAYVIIQELNEELAKQGYRVVASRVPTKFFKEKFYGMDGAYWRGDDGYAGNKRRKRMAVPVLL